MTEARRYRPEIDGLRALAVLPVMFFHAGVPGFPGGFVGVDVFFVISGFLITRIIATELAERRFSIVGFYERRARRILPALSVVLVAATGVAAVLMAPTDLVQYAKSLAATVLFASNLWFWGKTGGYFTPEVDGHPLLHIWSLAVEEQFYIVFPLLLMACVRWFPARVRLLAWLVTAGSLALAAWQVRFAPTAAFYLAPARAWELGLGSLLALGAFPDIRARPLREGLGWAAILMILLPVLLYGAGTPFPGLAALPPCLGAALLIHLGDSGAGRALRWKPLVWVGLISYSLYLWHWPVIVLARGVFAPGGLPIGLAAAAILVSLALGWLSWRYVERPFRSPARVSRRAIFLASAAAGAALLALAFGLARSHGLPQRFSPQGLAVAEARFQWNPRLLECIERPPGRFCTAGKAGTVPGFLLWGDSHANALQAGIELAATRAGVSGYVAIRRACAPLIGVRHAEPGCTEANAATIAWLAAHPEIRLVILGARWPLWQSGRLSPGEPGPARPLAPLGSDAGGDPPRLYAHAVAETVAALRRTGRRVLVVGDVPEIGWNVPARLSAAQRFGAPLPPVPTPAQVASRQAPADSPWRRAGVEHLPMVPLLCSASCRVTDAAGVPLYMDDDHLSVAGAREVFAPAIEPVLRTLR